MRKVTSWGLLAALLLLAGAHDSPAQTGPALHGTVLEDSAITARRDGAVVDRGREGLSFETEASFFDALDRYSAANRQAALPWNLVLSGMALAGWTTAWSLTNPRWKLAAAGVSLLLTGLGMTYDDWIRPMLHRRADRGLTRTMDAISDREGDHLLLSHWGRLFQVLRVRTPASWEDRDPPRAAPAAAATPRPGVPERRPVDWNGGAGAWNDAPGMDGLEKASR